MRNFRFIVVIFSLVWAIGCEKKKDELIEAPGDQAPADAGNTQEQTPPPEPNHPPIAFDANFVVKSDEVFRLPVPGEDIDGDGLVYTVEVGPQNGVVSAVDDGLNYEPHPGFVGVDRFEYSVSDSKQSSKVATVKIFVVKNQINSSFWLRSEDIQHTNGDGGLISNWTEAISGKSAAFVDADKTPRFVENLSNHKPGVQFEFVDGDVDHNDFMYFSDSALFSETDGLSFIAVGETSVFSSAVAPVFSLGEWTSTALGFNWSATEAGVVTPIQSGGQDNSNLLTVSGGGLSILVSQIRFSSKASNNGFQRVRINGGAWMNSDTTLGVTKLSSAELSTAVEPSPTATPIMIGATSSYATEANHRFSGKLGELLVMDRFLSNQELEIIETYLKTKFNIP